MSRQAEQDERWLGNYRRVVPLILLLILISVLVRGYRMYRAEAQATSLALFGTQFAERVQQLHGLWLAQSRPAVLYTEGVAWQFDKRGWPLAVLPARSPQQDCDRLWSTLIDPPALSSPQVRLSRDGGGCEFGWGDNWLHYRFSDGSVREIP